MEKSLIICSTQISSYEKHLELINLEYIYNAPYFYVHKDMPNLHELAEGEKLKAGFCGSFRYFMLRELTNVEYREYFAQIANNEKTSKAVEILLTVIQSIFKDRAKLYELARMVTPKNHNITTSKSIIDDKTKTEGVATSFTLFTNRINKMKNTKLFNTLLIANRIIYHDYYRYRYRQR